jgi:hypothetical protein
MNYLKKRNKFEEKSIDNNNSEKEFSLRMCDIKHCKYNCNDSFDLIKQSQLNKLYNKLSNLEQRFIYDNVKKGINLKHNKDKYEYKLIGETVCRKFL